MGAMTRMLVLYYSAWGHTEVMARAVVDGARNAGAEVTLKRVPETLSPVAMQQAGIRQDGAVPVASVDELHTYDGIVFGTPTRFGNMCGQMRSFLDQTGELWSKGALIGKVGSVFTSSGTQHGGQESTILSFVPTLLHHGMVVVGLPYSFTGQMGTDAVHGGSPYGAATLAGADGGRKPLAVELDAARFQGRHVAEIATRLSPR
jgi:NAD(P)H dehydrogenase (quinone)